jgi:hypothetical protein
MTSYPRCEVCGARRVNDVCTMCGVKYFPILTTNFTILKEDSHEEWDGNTFTAPITGGTYQATLPKGLKLVFTNGTITAPKDGEYVYEVDEDNNLVYFKLKEK